VFELRYRDWQISVAVSNAGRAPWLLSGRSRDDCMSITIHLDLPDSIAKEAQANGLLESDSMTELISTELRRRKAARELNGVLHQIREQPGEPMSTDEIQSSI